MGYPVPSHVGPNGASAQSPRRGSRQKPASVTAGALKLSALAALVFCMSMSAGCTYLRYRLDDALEVVDVGIVVSYKPGLALWFAAPFSLAAGLGGHVDGYCIGLAGGRPLFTPHYLNAIGILVFGFEEIGWGKFDTEDPATLYRTYQGVLGIPLSLIFARPAYVPTCTHQVHVLFLGAIANLRYMEVLDFVVGFTTLDIAGDDGRDLGHWPWRSAESMDKQSRKGILWPW